MSSNGARGRADTPIVARLRSAPSPERFTDAWSEQFREVVTEAAGRDGRLTRSAAHRIAERRDGGQVFSDTAVEYLHATNKRSVAIERLLGDVRPGVLEAARDAAGPDGRLSLGDGARLRSDLVEDFRLLRGVGPARERTRTAEELARDVEAVVRRVFDEGRPYKLARPPASVRGRRPVVERLEHAASGTTLSAYVANGKIYVSRASVRPSPLVGWYFVAPLPPPSP